MTTHTPMNRARDIWWTLDFASAILFPGVNSRGELIPSHGASRRRLGDYSIASSKLDFETFCSHRNLQLPNRKQNPNF
jgi:hypothetical protein